MNFRTTGLFLLLPLLAACTRSHDPAVAAGYQLVWEEEFSGESGALPAAEAWHFDTGTDWGNNQLEYDTDRAENACLDGDGHLLITAREEQFGNCSYTSARITTADLFEPKYGRIEARIQLPIGQGIWPAFWLLGNDIGSVGWPTCGEVDIMEYRGQAPTVIQGTLHGPNYYGGNGIGNAFSIYPESFHDDFHVFAVEWTSDAIEWSVDEVVYHRVESDEVPGEWVFDHPFYIILNVAVGGNYVGSPDASTLFPQTMIVDWVRVYQEQ